MLTSQFQNQLDCGVFMHCIYWLCNDNKGYSYSYSGHHTSSMETLHVLLVFFLSVVLALCDILSICDTPERLHGLENVTRVSMDTVASSKQVKMTILGQPSL